MYLPANKFAIGLANLKRYAYEVAGLQCNKEPRILLLLSYMEDTWEPLAAWLSKFNNPETTTNVCELSHRWFLRDMGAHTPIFQFLGNNEFYFITTQVSCCNAMN